MIENTIKLFKKINVKNLENTLQNKFLRYDKKGDEHYNVISAFIKSMRASQADAALYYLARMVEAGEDPLFIARRMVIFASEDIGLADEVALNVANSVFRACEIIGYPECAINLAHATCYLAKASKSKVSTLTLRRTCLLKSLKEKNICSSLKQVSSRTAIRQNITNDQMIIL